MPVWQLVKFEACTSEDVGVQSCTTVKSDMGMVANIPKMQQHLVSHLNRADGDLTGT